jgi:hypothetical protein
MRLRLPSRGFIPIHRLVDLFYRFAIKYWRPQTGFRPQYDDDIEFLSKDGGIVKGRAAIGDMFKNALKPPSGGGQCGMKLIPEHTVVIGDTVNVVWRVEAPFFAAPYRGSEAFETRNGLLVLQVTTWDPSAIKMKK